MIDCLPNMIDCLPTLLLLQQWNECFADYSEVEKWIAIIQFLARIFLKKDRAPKRTPNNLNCLSIHKSTDWSSAYIVGNSYNSETHVLLIIRKWKIESRYFPARILLKKDRVGILSVICPPKKKYLKIFYNYRTSTYAVHTYLAITTLQSELLPSSSHYSCCVRKFNT